MPTPFARYTALIAAPRLLLALVAPVQDCDEVFNYWEPLAHLAGRPFALMTWEYAPQYALRTYAYVAAHLPAARLAAALLPGPGPAAFYALRAGLALLAAAAEASLAAAAGRRFGADLGATMTLLSAASAGGALASSALLPSSAAMALSAVALARWVDGDWRAAAAWAVAATIVPGWPFVAVMFAPLALHALRTSGLGPVAARGLACGAAALAPCALLDAALYRAAVSPLWNVVKYNALNDGDDLYGTEPLSYYAKNLLLNLNLAAVLALALPALLLASLAAGQNKAPAAAAWSGATAAECGQALLFASPAAVWLAVMASRPHKEERFLYVAYPALHLAAAFGATAAAAAASRCCGLPRAATRALVVAGAAALSAARAAALVAHYGAPLAAWRFLSADLAARLPAGAAAAAAVPLTVCVGGEWHRYPSSFFLPAGASLAFVRSGFAGQLPQPYGAAPWAAPPQPFNDANGDEPARYLADAAACDYAVVLERHGGGCDDAPTCAALGDPAGWHRRLELPYLDAGASTTAARALWLPGLRGGARFGKYVVLGRRPGEQACGVGDHDDGDGQCA